MYQIAYGTDTESIEDPTQIVLLALPDECATMDADELQEFIDDNWGDFPRQPLIGYADVKESFVLAMRAAGIAEALIGEIVTTVDDAVDNND